MKDLISIIIPSYNRAEFLGSTLDSVYNQSYSTWECIIIDDDSYDYTPELMEFYTGKDKRFKYYKRPKNLSKGANACRNYGFKLSDGKFINWFDSDDLMHPDFLKLKLGGINESGALCSICKFKTFKFVKKQIVYEKETIIGGNDIIQNLISGNYPIPTHSPLWRKTYLNTIKLFDENLSISQDLEFHSRALQKESKVNVVDQFLFYVRKGHENITNELYTKTYKHFTSFFHVRKELISRFPNDQFIKRYIVQELMAMFRFLLTLKEYKNSHEILNFIKEIEKPCSPAHRYKIIKILLLFYFIRIVGKGETKFKKYLYLYK